MEVKKNPEFDLERRSPLFFSIGLVTAMLLVLAAFEYRSEFDGVDIAEPFDPFEEPYIIPNTVIPPPKVPEVPPQPDRTIQPDPAAAIVEATEDIPEQFIAPVDEPTDFDPNAIPELVSPPIEVPNTIWDFVESMPEFPGGIDAFYDLLSKEIKYPAAPKRMDIQGRVFVQFIIDETGKITNMKVIKGVHADIDAEALRALGKVPNFIPGKQRGVPVKVRMVIPIQFTLN